MSGPLSAQPSCPALTGRGFSLVAGRVGYVATLGGVMRMWVRRRLRSEVTDDFVAGLEVGEGHG
jgi:hypothetical protein